MTRRNSDHVVMGPAINQMHCRHCGTVGAHPTPVALRIFGAWMKAFIRLHIDCPPTTEEKK